MLCLSLCVVGKVVDMSNLAAVSDTHGRSPLVCARFPPREANYIVREVHRERERAIGHCSLLILASLSEEEPP